MRGSRPWPAPESPVKILHVITKLELGGAQQNTLHTCRELSSRGHDVTLAFGPGGMLDEEAALGGHSLRPVPDLVREIRPVRDLRALVALTRLVNELEPDIVHTHGSKAGALGRLGSWAGGATRLVHSVHGWSFAENMPRVPRAAYRAVEHACAPLTDHFVCVSARDLALGERLHIVRKGKGSVIRSGFDLSAFRHVAADRDALRHEWGIAPDDVLIVNVSNFKAQKAPLDFVRAASIASRQDERLRFVFVGDGPLRPEVEHAVAALGLGCRLLIAGWRRDIPRVLCAADIVALTSLWEGLPRTVVQARACGRTVVATAVNGTPEVVEDGVTGFLVRPRDVESMARAFVTLARDAGLRQRIGSRAAQGLEEFDETTMVDLQEALYQRLLKRSS